MKAVRIHQYGGLEALKYEEVPPPEPKEGEARVKIEVSGVNFIDIYHRLGRYQTPLPLTLGQEAAGTVEAVGPNVKEVKLGDRVVFASVQGTYAEYAIAPAWRLIQIPKAVNPESGGRHHGSGHDRSLSYSQHLSAEERRNGIGPRRGRWYGTTAGADCEIVWRARHRYRLHSRKSRACQSGGRGRCDSLQPD